MTMREIALKLLLDYEDSGKYVNLSLNSHLADKLSREERGQLTALLYTTVERKITLDYIIGALAGRSVDRLSVHTLAVLRLGICQLLYMESIPDFAAVNETVKLAKNPGERSLVNGVLRTAVRRRGKLPMPDKAKNAARYYSVAYSLPLATVRHFMNLLGEDESVRLFESFNHEPPLTATVNTLKISVDDFLKNLEKSGYVATRAKFSPISVRISGNINPKNLPGFDEGHFLVQDEASAIAASLHTKSRVIVDVCSAPGGKAMTAAILTGDSVEIHAFDLHSSKLSLIEGSASRLGIASVTVAQRDATTPVPTLLGRADSVICDVPCSGLGVIAKKPDLRYKPIEDIFELNALQSRILTCSAEYLRVGGTLVYSTCTLNKAENEDIVRDFLEKNPEFSTVPIDLFGEQGTSGMITLYPHIHETDGFFIAVLKKTK